MSTKDQIYIDFWRKPMDFSFVCRNFRQTASGANVRMGNRAILRSIGAELNRILGRLPRPVFGMAQPFTAGNTTQAEDAGSDPLYQWRYYDGVPNGRTQTMHIIYAPRTGGAGNAFAQAQGAVATPESMTAFANSTVAGNKFCDNLGYAYYTVERGAAADGIEDFGISTFNGYQIIDCFITDDPLNYLTSDYDRVDPGLAFKGGEVLADLAEDVRAKLHTLRTENLPICINWSAYAEGDAWLTPVSTNENGIVVTSNTYVNVLDQTATARDENSPGVLCPAQYAGVGAEDETRGESVPVRVDVLAKQTGGDGPGYLQVIGPDHVGSNDVEVEIADGAGVTWYTDAGRVSLNTGIDDLDTSTERNKLDILAKAGTSGTLYIYGIRAWYEVAA